MVDEFIYDDVDESLFDDDSFTVSYAFDTKFWIAFHDYIPSFMFATRNQNLYSFNGNGLYQHHQDNYGKYYNGIVYPAVVTPTFRPATETENRRFSFILNSVNYGCDFYLNEIDLSERLLQKTLSTISFHNSYQSSSETPLVTVQAGCSLKEQWAGINTRRVKNVWYFNKIRDETINENLSTVVEKFDEVISNVVKVNCDKKRRLFIDDFVIVRLKYNNQDQLSMQFSQIDFDITLVKR